MLKLIGAWLRVGVLEDGVVTTTVAGTPQGSPISPLLANVALHAFDAAWEQQRAKPGVLIRASGGSSPQARPEAPPGDGTKGRRAAVNG
jgi:retron-type reverse transcriptase